MSDQRHDVSQFDWSNVLRVDPQSPTITHEQVVADWQAGHDQDFPAVFEAEERARAKAYASEHGLALTLEYISRLEEIARASLVLLKHDMLYVDPVAEPKRSEVYNALRAVDLLDM